MITFDFDYPEEEPARHSVKGGEPTQEEQAEAFEMMFREEWSKQ